uniref:Uncharacterized protein n=1 Tax=viral metagenome TaxID=1070528 RepID=A0A6C0CPF4_9ZZZZ
MKSSREGTLGLKSRVNFQWKGRTFSQITSILQKNDRNNHTVKSKKTFFKALPNTGYRREIITNINNTKNIHSSISLLMDTPGSTIVNGNCSECIGNPNTLEIQQDNNDGARPCSACDVSLTEGNPEYKNSKYLHSLSQQDNARRRVRSSGMAKPRYDINKNGRLESFMSSKQYMHSRNKTFSQNQFNNIRIGDSSVTAGHSNTLDNKYASNTIQHCDGNSDSMTKYVPIYYKPSNSKFAHQGSVDSSARLLRLKYDTITKTGNRMREAYGTHTANALAYGVPENGYTIKDKIGYPNICSPKFPKGYSCK